MHVEILTERLCPCNKVISIEHAAMESDMLQQQQTSDTAFIVQNYAPFLVFAFAGNEKLHGL